MQAAHADTFVKCLQFCSTLLGCDGVTYLESGGNPQASNCYPVRQFNGYQYGGQGNTILSGVPIDGPIDGSNTPNDICAEGYNGTTYTDFFGCQYDIGCGFNLDGNDLVGTATANFQACVLYCSIYATCEGVTFVGDGSVQPNSNNCYPRTNAGAVSQSGSVSYAQIIPFSCNVS